MATKEKRPSAALTLAAKAAQLKERISAQYCPNSAGSGAGSLPVGLPAPLPGDLPGADKYAASRLGRPLDIRHAAAVIGCSPWTVRQKLIPMGLPHFRSGASGKLIFYEAQIIRWIEGKQAQGGKLR